MIGLLEEIINDILKLSWERKLKKKILAYKKKLWKINQESSNATELRIS